MVALRIEERPLGRPHLAMTEVERQVAAKDPAALARNPVGEARRHLADPGNGHDAERDAGDEHIEAAGTRARPRKAKRSGSQRVGTANSARVMLLHRPAVGS